MKINQNRQGKKDSNPMVNLLTAEVGSKDQRETQITHRKSLSLEPAEKHWPVTQQLKAARDFNRQDLTGQSHTAASTPT